MAHGGGSGSSTMQAMGVQVPNECRCSVPRHRKASHELQACGAASVVGAEEVLVPRHFQNTARRGDGGIAKQGMAKGVAYHFDL